MKGYHCGEQEREKGNFNKKEKERKKKNTPLALEVKQGGRPLAPVRGPVVP